MLYLKKQTVKIRLRITAPEALSCIGNMFFGQLESLMLIGPCLDQMTASELVMALGAGKLIKISLNKYEYSPYLLRPYY